MLNKTLAGFFAVFLGLFGVHYFYVGKWWKGVLQFAFFWTMVFLVSNAGGPAEELFGMLTAISVIMPVITGLVWFAMPKKSWQLKYDPQSVQENIPLALASGLPKDTKALKAEGIRYYRSADYDLAIEAFQEASAADISDPGTHFNLACSFAQLGQYPEAMRHLEVSLTFGLPKPERIEKHPALAAMRKHSAYKTFRANNYRRLNLLELSEQEPLEEDEILEDFAAPPTPPRSARKKTGGPTAAFPDSAPPPVDLLEQIARLRELHDAGVLTQREYQVQKEKLLG